ncbi:cache domain-containing protein, partial [Paracoccus sp. (in: a-proteobacteria)]
MREEDNSTGFPEGRTGLTSRWGLRGVIAVLLIVAAGTIWFTNAWLTARFSETTRMRTELRAALYTGNLLSELQRTSVVPLLLARDPALISALSGNDFSGTSARLISAQKEIAAASIKLLDASGRVVGSTDRNLIGTNYVQEPFFVEALRSKDTVFTVSSSPQGAYEFTYSRTVVSDGRTLGVVVVGADLSRLVRSWAGISDAIAVTDSSGQI